KLKPGSIAQVLHATEKNRLLRLRKEYHAEVHDGTQWLLWIQQGGSEKSVYFNNSFPREIVRFAEVIDKVLEENGLENARWVRVTTVEAQAVNRELWDSIKR